MLEVKFKGYSYSFFLKLLTIIKITIKNEAFLSYRYISRSFYLYVL